jgi:hypothetical protein
MSIKIELDLEVEVDLYARVKGDVTIGLMWTNAYFCSNNLGQGGIEAKEKGDLSAKLELGNMRCF